MSVTTPPHATPDHARPDESPEALIPEARQRTRRRRRRQTAGVLAILGFGVVAFGITQIASGGSTTTPGRPHGLVTVGSEIPGPYWYTRSITTNRQPLPVVPRVMGLHEKAGPVPLVYFIVRSSTETWIGQDGTIRQRIVTLSRRFASAADRRRWTAAHQQLPDGTQGGDSIIAGDGLFPASANVPSGFPGDPGDGLFTYRQLLDLPVTTAKLRARLIAAETALTRREVESYVRPGRRHAQTVAKLERANASDSQLYLLIELLESPIPQQDRIALTVAIAGMPGVKTTGSTSPHQIVLSETGNLALTVTVNARTGELISIAGPYVGTGTVVAQGTTTSTNSLPRGVAPILGHPSVLPPTGVTVTPARGTSTTAFRIQTPVPSATRSPFLQAEIYGPTGPDCTFWASHPPVARIPAGHPASIDGKAVDEYQLQPSAISRTTWCPGTYEIQITPSQMGRVASKQLAGPSATYITVTH